jgi:histidinol dehydrogenase
MTGKELGGMCHPPQTPRREFAAEAAAADGDGGLGGRRAPPAFFLSTAENGFERAFEALLDQARDTTARVDAAVAAIIAAVRAGGDAALCDYTRRFDRNGVAPETLRVTPAEIDAACATVPAALVAALDLAATRIEAFHQAQLPIDLQMHDDAGVTMGMRWTALDAVGLYVPGGKAAYPSSVLMNALPARVAGVGRIAMVVPAPDGVLNPAVLAAARRAGVSEIFRTGGAQAVAALAYGTETIRPVDRIVGPGNAYVAEAKRQVFGRVGIDGVAGPSEVVVLADAANDPARVAIDLLAQAEHDEAAQSILITDSAAFARAVADAVAEALATLPRAAIAGASWRDHGAIILVRGWDEAAELTNRLAPEHLQIMVPEPHALFARIRHAGAAFLGSYTPEALGDYIAGPNHVLPTGRTARYASGLSVFDFIKRTTWIDASAAALAAIGPAGVALAEAEGLTAHARSLAMRLGQ